MKNLIKSSSILGATEVALILVSIVRAKYLAVNIGPEGYGEYSILVSYFAILTAMCSGWLARGTIKYIAEYKQKDDIVSVYKVHNYSISIAFILTAIATVLAFIFQDFVRTHFLSHKIILWHYLLFAASFFATSITPFFAWLLQGFLLVKETVKIRIITTLFGFLYILIFVYFYGITGYFVSILISSIFGLYLYWKATHNFLSTKLMLPNFKDEIFKKLMRFGGVNFILLILHNITEYIQRVFILNALDITSVGLFHVANSIMNYMGIANRASTFVNDSKMSQDLSIEEYNKSLNDFIRFNILTGLPISVILILFSKDFITLLYSKEFTSLAPILIAFVFAQFLAFLAGGFHSVMLGKAFLKMHSIVSILNMIIILVIPYFFISQYGLLIIGISMIAGNIMTLLLDYCYLNIKISFKLSHRVLAILTISILCFYFSYLLQSDSSVVFINHNLKELVPTDWSKSTGEYLNYNIKYIEFSCKIIFIILMSTFLFITLTKTERMKLINLVKSK